ncbi:hypothetical protein [Pengzhenrongella phosphoraccumulans]|uniref:hypothetical protein n=1 Tax=Pengzhenrongella phosphoraccumulans TaxID=3114394 RepID=UPI003890A547
MREPVSPVAVRLRRPSWRDPRLLAGLVMVAGAVALGSWAVSAAQAYTPVYVARGTLVPGESVGAGDLVVGQVRLSPAEAGHYLAVTAAGPPELVVLRTVFAGELVPASAVGSQASLDVRPVPVQVTDTLSDGVVAGARVDLWVTAATEGDVGPPSLLAEGLEVAEVSRPSGAFAVGARTTVHVLVPTGSLPAVLGALAAPGAVQLVLVPGTGG